jgi:hypothetical protein
MKNPLEIRQNIGIGKGDVELYHSVSIDGHVVIEETKGDSLVGNFLSIMYSFCGGTTFPQDMYGHYDASVSNYYSYSVGGAITNAVSSGVNTVITIDDSSFSSSEGVQISGLIGDWAACNGFWIPVATSGVTVTIAVDSALFGALDLTESPFAIRKYKIGADNYRADLYTFGQPRVKLGTSNRAVGLDDQCLISEVHEGSSAREVAHTTTVVAIPASDGADVEMSLGVSIANNSGGAIAIKEAGIYAYAYDYPSNSDYTWVLIARDLFTTSIADGKTAAVTYKITSTLSTEGGLTRQFMEVLYRQLSRSSLAIKDIEGVSNSDNISDGAFMLAGGSGNNIQYSSYSGYTGQYVGVQLGIGNTAVTTDDYVIEDRVDHGDATVIDVSAGTSGNLVITIDGTNYSEAFDTSIATTVANWLDSHTSTLAALGTPIKAEAHPSITDLIYLYKDAAMTLVDNSTGDFAWTSAGQLRYYGQLVENWLYGDTPGEASFDVIRIFENVSGSSITINETALYAAVQDSYALNVNMMARHVLTTPVTVAHGEILKVTYTISITV